MPFLSNPFGAISSNKVVKTKKKKENEAKPSFFLCFTSVQPRHSMFLKQDRATSDAVLFLLENSFQNINN